MLFADQLSRRKLPHEEKEEIPLDFFDFEPTTPATGKDGKDGKAAAAKSTATTMLEELQVLKGEALLHSSKYVPRCRSFADWNARWSRRASKLENLAVREGMARQTSFTCDVAAAYGWKFAMAYLSSLEPVHRNAAAFDVSAAHSAALQATKLKAKARKRRLGLG